MQFYRVGFFFFCLFVFLKYLELFIQQGLRTFSMC